MSDEKQKVTIDVQFVVDIPKGVPLDGVHTEIEDGVVEFGTHDKYGWFTKLASTRDVTYLETLNVEASDVPDDE